MHQHAILANEVDVFVVDFEVENGLRAGAGEFLLDDFDVAAERLRKRPTNPFLSGSVVWSPVSSGFQISPDEAVHE